MSKRYGVCTNIGGCNKADGGVTQEIDDLSDFKCEECDLELAPSSKPSSGKPFPKKLLVGLGGIAILGFLLWGFTGLGSEDDLVCCTDSIYHKQSEVDDEIFTSAGDESICLLKKCIDNCATTDSPVCGTDGKTYSNACIAKCRGIDVKKQGSCTERIPPEIKKRYERVALNKIKSLEKYLQTITDESEPMSDRDYAFREAENLFTDEALIEVSSLRNPDSEYYEVKEYLSHLQGLTYSKIVVEWSEIAYVSEFKKVAGSNRYEAVATVYQDFTGFGPDNMPIYKDATVKYIKVVLEKESSVINGKEITAWDVFLSDTTVKDTQPG